MTKDLWMDIINSFDKKTRNVLLVRDITDNFPDDIMIDEDSEKIKTLKTIGRLFLRGKEATVIAINQDSEGVINDEPVGSFRKRVVYNPERIDTKNPTRLYDLGLIQAKKKKDESDKNELHCFRPSAILFKKADQILDFTENIPIETIQDILKQKIYIKFKDNEFSLEDIIAQILIWYPELGKGFEKIELLRNIIEYAKFKDINFEKQPHSFFCNDIRNFLYERYEKSEVKKLKKFGLLDYDMKVKKYRDFLVRFFRKFVEEKLNEHYGKEWWKEEHIPRHVMISCNNIKKSKIIERRATRTDHPFKYAYFIHLKDIILKENNWFHVFKDSFHYNKEVDIKNKIDYLFKELWFIRGDESHVQKISKKDAENFKMLATDLLDTIKGYGEDKIEFQELVESLEIHISSQQKLITPIIDLPTIQSILRRDNPSIADFFKREPEWIDFQEGCIIERNEVDMIIDSLPENPIQLLVGAPASGKSIILKNIGFKLAIDKDWKVYFIDFDKYPKEQLIEYLMNIMKLDDEKTLIILDDAHFDLPSCETLLFNFKSKNIKSKLIIGSRKTKRITVEHPIEPSAFEDLIKVEISSLDIVEKLVHLFLYTRYRLNNERIEIISKNLKKYKRNLWYLSWALKAFIPDKDTVEDVDIYKKLFIYITNINLGKSRYINAENILLPLSVFFRYEIPIERRFLENQLKIQGDLINKLTTVGEIKKWRGQKGGELIALHHSSMAELYFDTYKYYKDLGGEIKYTIGIDDWDSKLFHQYFQSKPEYIISSLSKLYNAYLDGYLYQDPLVDLFNTEITIEKIFENVNESMIIRNINNLRDDLRKLPHKIFVKDYLSYLGETTILDLLKNSKLNQIRSFLGWSWYYYNSIDVQKAYKIFVEEYHLFKKMYESTLYEINSFLHGLRHVEPQKTSDLGKNLAQDAIKELEKVDNIPEKLADSSIEAIQLLLYNIYKTGKDPQFIINQIKPPFNLIPKLEVSSLNDINMLILNVDRADIASGKIVPNSKFIIDQVKQMNQTKLARKMEESTLKNINDFIANIKRNNGEFVACILNLIRQLDITEKLQETYLFSTDAILEGELDKNIISEKLKNIFQEHRFPLSDVANLAKDKENTWMIAGKSNIILRKENEQINVYQESNISDISWFLWNISDDNSLSAKYSEILDNIDLIEKIEKTTLEGMNYLFWNLFQISSDVPKIFSNEDIHNVLLNRMSKHNVSIVEKLQIIGILKYASSSILAKSVEKVFMTSIAEKELENWLNKNYGHPYKIGLALEGFRIVNEKKSLSFIRSYSKLNKITDWLMVAEIKNEKSSILIENVLRWLKTI